MHADRPSEVSSRVVEFNACYFFIIIYSPWKGGHIHNEIKLNSIFNSIHSHACRQIIRSVEPFLFVRNGKGVMYLTEVISIQFPIELKSIGASPAGSDMFLPPIHDIFSLVFFGGVCPHPNPISKGKFPQTISIG